jgi:altronate dehydratase large subunit
MMDFKGFERKAGRAGVRNHLLIVSTVVCANATATAISSRLRSAVLLTHGNGCCMLQPDIVILRRTLFGCAMHPNVGAVLAVGLGCEQIAPEEIAGKAEESGRLAMAITIQGSGGHSATVSRGVKAARRMMAEMRHQKRRSLPLTEIILGTECGSSDFTSGLGANPVVGCVADRFIRHGGAVVLSETPEMLGAERMLESRAVDPGVASHAMEILHRVEETSRRFALDIRGSQPTVGNMRGGISTIEEKSLGSIRKGGSAPIEGVVEYAETILGNGLWLMDTPGQDVESLTGMVAGGIQVVLFSTGLGTPVGNPIAPVIKVTANSDTAKWMHEHIDFDASESIASGSDPRHLEESLFRLVVNVASGQKTRAEQLGHSEFGVWRVAPTL